MAIPAQMYSWAVMENSCGLNNLYFVQQEREDLMQRNSFLQKGTDDHHSVFSQSILHQRDEIDLLINAQNERLRIVLQEQRKKELALVMKRYECLIEQKDEDILKAINKNMELQNHQKRMEIEIQKWQRLAGENEAMIASLKRTIQEVRESVPAKDDAESSCAEDEREIRRWDQETRKMVCRCCNSRKSCVIMLPCRHLCSCRYCDVFLDSCPVCNEVKKSSVEAYL
ncbi:hypothetical protein ACS0TY_004053 [Phlomoides rotata]